VLLKTETCAVTWNYAERAGEEENVFRGPQEMELAGLQAV
jgi:hypothetical protein